MEAIKIENGIGSKLNGISPGYFAQQGLFLALFSLRGLFDAGVIPDPLPYHGAGATIASLVWCFFVIAIFAPAAKKQNQERALLGYPKVRLNPVDFVFLTLLVILLLTGYVPSFIPLCMAVVAADGLVRQGGKSLLAISCAILALAIGVVTAGVGWHHQMAGLRDLAFLALSLPYFIFALVAKMKA